MTQKEILYFIGGVIAAKAIEDNIPSFHYRKVIATTRKVFSVCYLLIVWLLMRTGIIKPSPKFLIVLFSAVAIIALFKWAENRNRQNAAYA